MTMPLPGKKPQTRPGPLPMPDKGGKLKPMVGRPTTPTKKPQTRPGPLPKPGAGGKLQPMRSPKAGQFKPVVGR